MKNYKFGLEGIFAAVLITVLVVLLFNSDKGRKEDKKEYIELMKSSNKTIKKATQKIDSLEQENDFLLKHYKDVSQHIIKIDEDLKKSIKENEKLKKSRPILYTDKQLDSLRTAWYPR